MANIRTKSWLLVLPVLIILALFLYFRSGDEYNWAETYKTDTKDPYGTAAVHQLLSVDVPGKGIYDMKDKVKKELSSSINGAYVLIGESFYLDSTDQKALFDFVEKGNTAFIACKVLPSEFIDTLFNEPCNEDWEWLDFLSKVDTMITANLLHPQLELKPSPKYRFAEKSKTTPYRWDYFDNRIFCDSNDHVVRLGNIETEFSFNFIKIPRGKGQFFLHTSPLFFTNFQLTDSIKWQYVQHVFTHLPPQKVYWDEHHLISEAAGRRHNEDNGFASNRSLSSKTPLSYILSQPGLAWAWYLTLLTALFFLVFRAKRRQRPIPVLEENTNTTRDFITTIGRLYFLQKHHEKLASQKLKLFLGFVRERYQLSTRELDRGFIHTLSEKSSVPVPLIEEIISYVEKMNHLDASEDTLIKVQQLVEKFYITCK